MRRARIALAAWTALACERPFRCARMGSLAREFGAARQWAGKAPPVPMTAVCSPLPIALVLTLAASACGGAVATSASSDGGSGPADCTILASNYDQSCTVDTDCVLVTTGNWCGTGCLCAVAAINTGASAAFNEATAQTPVGSGEVSGDDCPCPPVPGPCCRQGGCTTSCLSQTDTLPTCADAGGTCEFSCVLSDGELMGPMPVCAYADEVCCVPSSGL